MKGGKVFLAKVTGKPFPQASKKRYHSSAAALCLKWVLDGRGAKMLLGKKRLSSLGRSQNILEEKGSIAVVDDKKRRVLYWRKEGEVGPGSPPALHERTGKGTPSKSGSVRVIPTILSNFIIWRGAFTSRG